MLRRTGLTTGPTWNYTTVLNFIFLGIIAVLGWRFLRTGGPEMLRMMQAAPAPPRPTGHEGHGHEPMHHH